MKNLKLNPEVAAVVVAGGSGSRMGASFPKQYSMVADKTILEHSVDVMLSDPRVSKVVVVISPSDLLGQKLEFKNPRVHVARVGGATRTDSVRNGTIYAGMKPSDWILVHDAARPCLLSSDLSKLIDFCLTRDCGAILAVPLNDTLKEASETGKITRTISREHLWCAQTPQCFKSSELLKALNQNGIPFTDEASALEACGVKPAIVEGTPTNIKITRPMDLWIAKAIFEARKKGPYK